MLFRSMPAYKGKGRFYKQVDLSLQGLLGAGYLEYIASRSDSRLFVSLPDSMNAKTDKFICSNKSSVEFPEVNITKTHEHWYPYQDSMIVHQVAEPFFMYGGEALHRGSLVVQPFGLSGIGESRAGEMIVESFNFRFRAMSYDADTADFTLTALNGEDIAFEAKEVKSKVEIGRASCRERV